MEKLNCTFKREYRGMEIEIVIEDDLITTTKAYAGDKCVYYCEVNMGNNVDGVPFCRKNLNAVLECLMEDVDKIAEERVDVSSVNA